MPMAGLKIELKPSFKLAGLVGVFHVLALAAAWLSLEGWPRNVVACGLLLSAAGCLSEILHRTSGAAVSLELLDDDHFVSAALVVMRLDRVQGGRKWLVLAPDSAAREDLRRLRVWLRWYREAGAEGSKTGTKPE
jgi:hypothetical protein